MSAGIRPTPEAKREIGIVRCPKQPHPPIRISQCIGLKERTSPQSQHSGLWPSILHIPLEEQEEHIFH